MSTSVRFQVCGTTEDGWDWHEPMDYPTFEEADERAEHWGKYEPEVWVEKITAYREIVKSISRAPQTPKEAWPV
jgi:hypothetical protein